jgi:hypothetical protein
MLDDLVYAVVKERTDYVTREVMRDWLGKAVSPMMIHCSKTRLAKALNEDPVLVKLHSILDSLDEGACAPAEAETEIRKLKARLG